MVYGAEIAVYSKINKKTQYSVGRAYNVLMLNLLVHHVTSRLWKVKTVLNTGSSMIHSVS
jgi:hypothetical protein